MTDNSGVRNPGVVDLITFDPKTDEHVLVMIETRPWDGSFERLKEIQDKVNNYLVFALDGEMVRKFPDSKNKRVRLQLNSFESPDSKTQEFLVAVAEKLRQNGVNFAIRKLDK